MFENDMLIDISSPNFKNMIYVNIAYLDIKNKNLILLLIRVKNQSSF